MINTFINVKHGEILSEWRAAVESGNINKAVNLDFKHYNELVKPTENQELWDNWQNETFKYRNEIQSNFEKIVKTKKSIENKKFLIVHHNYSGLANEAQLVRNIEFLKKNNEQINYEVAYLFGGNLKQQEAAIKLYQLEAKSIYFLQSKSYPDAGNRLNWLINNKSYSTIIYPSIFAMAFWMSLYVSHDNQKFLQMKYFPKQVGRISQWACGRKNSHLSFNYNNDNFTQLSVLNPKLASITGLNSNKISSNLHPNNVRFGSISRPEKISNSEYNEVILRILNNYNDLEYLYTGREESCHLIPAQIRDHPRTIALGWVEPEKVIEEFDIYLEPFPWGGGDMTFLALQSGLPYLTLDTPQNRIVGVYDFLYYMAADKLEILKFSFCNNLETLLSRLELLIRDKEYRKEIGGTWSEIINNYRPIDSDAWVKFLIK